CTLDGEYFRGRFEIQSNLYMCDHALQHLAAVEYQLFLNQFIYVFYGYAIDSSLSRYSHLISLQGFAKRHKTFGYILRNDMKLNRLVKPGQPIDSWLRLDSEKQLGNLYIGKLSYEFAHKACYGKTVVAFQFEPDKRSP
ncbi:MAG: hypothetical protein ACE5JC_08070, partial [Candidatus Zixiibacteriota bacterium]